MSDPWVHHPNVTGTDDLMLTRNFLLILLANIVLGSAMPMLIILGGLAGGWLAPHVWLATAPPSTQMLVGIIVLVIIFLTELTSNTATAAAFLPLLGALAISLGVDPLLITVPAAIAASCAFMMPVATPPNAIVFAAGRLDVAHMCAAGVFLNFAATAVIALAALYLVPRLF